MAIEVKLPDAPYPSPVVDAGRKITVPWRGWIAELIRRLAAGLEATAAAATILAGGTPIRLAVADLDLGPQRRRGGTAVLEGTFALEQIGAPVLAQIIPPRDEAQVALVVAVATVVSTRTLRVEWASSEPLVGRVRLHYVIGGRA